jgi:hypothetical protein
MRQGGGVTLVSEERWLKHEHEFVPGAELYRSERHFSVWAYGITHRQLLLRSRRRHGPTRIDVLFKPVTRLSIREGYAGLAIRCATEDESAVILADAGEGSRESRVLMLESGFIRDFVVAGAFGWREDDGDETGPSDLAFFPPGTDPGRLLNG